MNNDIFEDLSHKLLHQSFSIEVIDDHTLEESKKTAQLYAKIENAIAVLSDMVSDISFIYFGKSSEVLGFSKESDPGKLESIWEKFIFDRIHPDDLLQKHIHELRFFNMIKTIPIDSRSDYYVSSLIRMQDKTGIYLPIRHRMFYISSKSDGNLWLSLCLYNIESHRLDSFLPDNMVINSVTGGLIDLVGRDKDILSERECEVLNLIRKGYLSKEIANELLLSINTVNRHRQNILEKLRVSNSMEACRLAEKLRLI